MGWCRAALRTLLRWLWPWNSRTFRLPIFYVFFFSLPFPKTLLFFPLQNYQDLHSDLKHLLLAAQFPDTGLCFLQGSLHSSSGGDFPLRVVPTLANPSSGTRGSGPGEVQLSATWIWTGSLLWVRALNGRL